jgi:hypothetical protein
MRVDSSGTSVKDCLGHSWTFSFVSLEFATGRDWSRLLVNLPQERRQQGTMYANRHSIALVITFRQNPFPDPYIPQGRWTTWTALMASIDSAARWLRNAGRCRGTGCVGRRHHGWICKAHADAFSTGRRIRCRHDRSGRIETGVAEPCDGGLNRTGRGAARNLRG